MKKQSRAKIGGEIGANGEWYEGGKFIAMADNPKSHKPILKSRRQVEIEPYKWVDPRDDHSPILGGLRIENFDPVSKSFSFNPSLREEFASPEAIKSRQERINQYNAGKRWFNTSTGSFE